MDVIKKGWGQERIWVSNDYYCSKFLDFKQGARFSMHFHSEKVETWYVISGTFELEILDTTNANVSRVTLEEGAVWHNDILVPHRLICIEEGTVLEVSTMDTVEDNYRVFPGDSQR